MSRLRFLLLAVFLTLAAVLVGLAAGRWGHVPQKQHTTAAHADRGGLLFQMHCAVCHGPEGHGDGTSASTLRPPPRDFAARPWRFEPTADSIRRVTTDGIPGTAMPAFRSALSARDLVAVVDYVHDLATREPTVEYVPSEEERLLRAADFVDLRGTEPPPLMLSDAAGATIKLTDLRGKLVVVHFWGTACSHCLKEMPALCELEKQHGGRLVVVNVCADQDDPEEAQRVLDRTVPGVKALIDTTGLGLARFEVNSLPTVWLIDASGKAIGRASGSRDWNVPACANVLAHWLELAR
jgi:mono/diheme cytochrome c family protein/peroxiredoxin